VLVLVTLVVACYPVRMNRREHSTSFLKRTLPTSSEPFAESAYNTTGIRRSAGDSPSPCHSSSLTEFGKLH
jgi:hypothetical protein